MDNAKREMTIEEMIAAGTPWEKVKARIIELQRIQKEKEKMAAEAAALEKKKSTINADVARERAKRGVFDMLLAMELVEPDDRESIDEYLDSVMNDVIADLTFANALRVGMKIAFTKQ